MKARSSIRMRSLLRELSASLTTLARGDGVHATSVRGVDCIQFSKPGAPLHGNWRQSLCIVAQGGKQLTLDDQRYRYGEGDYVVASIDLPLVSRVARATADRPYLCLRIELEPREVGLVASQIGPPASPDRHVPGRGLFVGHADEKLLACALRLSRLLESPDDARVLAPLVIREALYYVLKGPHGAQIRQFSQGGTALQKVRLVAERIQARLPDELDLASLAALAGMSRSAFFSHFKAVTAMSPLQYQKRLRLLEARQLLIGEEENAEGAAFRVGYKSASQFSREYARMFGAPPARDAKVMKTRPEGEMSPPHEPADRTEIRDRRAPLNAGVSPGRRALRTRRGASS